MLIITGTVCRMDAAFERTWTCLQRVSAMISHLCLGLQLKGIFQAEQWLVLVLQKVNGTTVFCHNN